MEGNGSDDSWATAVAWLDPQSDATAGDTDQDGRADLLVGAHEFPDGGRAFLFWGTGC